jgi:hypothetical protein
MAPLSQRRSFLDRIEPLSVVALAISYAVLAIALATEWGRIVPVLAADVVPAADAMCTLPTC